MVTSLSIAWNIKYFTGSNSKLNSLLTTDIMLPCYHIEVCTRAVIAACVGTVFPLIEAGSQIQAGSLIEAGGGLRANTLPDW